MPPNPANGDTLYIDEVFVEIRDVRRALTPDARHIVMDVKALGEVFSFADVDGTMTSR